MLGADLGAEQVFHLEPTLLIAPCVDHGLTKGTSTALLRLPRSYYPAAGDVPTDTSDKIAQIIKSNPEGGHAQKTFTGACR